MHQRLSIYSPPSAYFEIRNTLKKLLFKNSSIFYLIFFRVRNWAQKLGGELWHFGELVTRRTMVIDVSKILHLYSNSFENIYISELQRYNNS